MCFILGTREGRATEASDDGDATAVEARHGEKPSSKGRGHQRIGLAFAGLQNL